jgi:hypothetical protein
LIVLWLVTGALALWAQGVIVCGKCGREAKPGDVVCRHCQDALPKPKIDAPPPAVEPTVPVNVEAEAGRMAAILVEANVRQARDLEAKQPELSLCHYQNAMALMRLVPAGTFPAAAGDAVVEGNTRLLNLLQRGAVPCRRCGGSGRYQLDLGKVDRSKGLKAVDGVPCTACKGAGAVPGFKEVSKAKMQILQGRTEFERRQMVTGDVKVGRVWVPPALEKLLTIRQRALLMTGLPLPCRDCQQTTRQTCTACAEADGNRVILRRVPRCPQRNTRTVRERERLNEGRSQNVRARRTGRDPLPALQGRKVWPFECAGAAWRRVARGDRRPDFCRVKMQGTGDVKGEPCPM